MNQSSGQPGDPGASIFVTMTEHAAVVHVGMTSIRDRQSQLLQERLLGVVEHAQGRVAVSMADVVDVTSACINALVVVSQRCRALGGRLVVFGLSDDLCKLFRLTRLDRLITLANHGQDALKHFEPHAAGRGIGAWLRRGREAA